MQRGGGFRSELGSGLLVMCSGEEGSKVCWEVDCCWCAVGGGFRSVLGSGLLMVCSGGFRSELGSGLLVVCSGERVQK